MSSMKVRFFTLTVVDTKSLNLNGQLTHQHIWGFKTENIGFSATENKRLQHPFYFNGFLMASHYFLQNESLTSKHRITTHKSASHCSKRMSSPP
jgi:hypothetical protein